MRSNHIYNKFKANIIKAKQSFSHYDRYKSCFSIRSMDNEMGEIFIRLGLHYSKLMHLTNKNKGAADSAVPDLVSIDDCEKLLKEKASFFNNIICFLERNEKRIIEALANRRTIEAMSNEVDAIETNLTDADKVVNRMDNMIKSQQQIYTVDKFKTA